METPEKIQVSLTGSRVGLGSSSSSVSQPSGEHEDLDSKERKETEEWGLARASRPSARIVNDSPLYRVLTELRDEANAWFQSLRIDYISNSRDAFLIRSDTLPANHLFTSFSFFKRHFSVDKLYNRSETTEHGFTPLHYTETYFSENTQETIVVHAYLDIEGQYIYSQIKIMKDNNAVDLNETEQKAREEQLRINVNTSTELLTNLFNERRGREQTARVKADKLEKELSEIAQSLEAAAACDIYIARAKQFIEAIKVVNQYSAAKDPRGENVARRLRDTETWKSRVLQASPADVSRPVSFGPVAVKASSEESQPSVPEEPKASEKLEDLFQEIIRELESLNQQLSENFPAVGNSTIMQIRARHTILEKTSPLLMVMVMASFKFSDFFVEPKKIKKLLHEIRQRQNRHDKEGLQLLEGGVLQGDVKLVQELFPLFGNNIKDSLYAELIRRLLTKKIKNKEQLMEVCEFLGKKSDHYRRFVAAASKSERYLLSRREMSSLFKKMAADQEPGSSYDSSMLFRAYCNHDFPLFMLLLEHGADRDSWSFTIKGGITKDFPLFAQISAYHTTGYFSYLKALLSYRVNPNFPQIAHTVTLADRKRAVESQSNRKLHKGELVKYTAVRPDRFMPPPLLGTFSENEVDMDYSQSLLLHMSVDAIAFCLATVKNSFKYTQFLSSKIGIEFAQDKKAAVERIQALRQSEIGDFLTYIIFPQSGVPSANTFKVLKCIHSTLIQKLKTLTPREFEKIYEALFKRGQEAARINDPDFSYNAIMGCHFLLLTRCKVLESEKEKLDLLIKYHPDFCRYMDILLPRQLPADAASLRQFYRGWKTVLENRSKHIRRNFHVKKRSPIYISAPFSSQREALQREIDAAVLVLLPSPRASGPIPILEQDLDSLPLLFSETLKRAVRPDERFPPEIPSAAKPSILEEGVVETVLIYNQVKALRS